MGTGSCPDGAPPPEAGRLAAPADSPACDGRRPLALLVLLSFISTFVLARAVVLLIMTRRIPALYLHLGGAHIHHLNYGIFLLAMVGAYLLYRQPRGHALKLPALAYGVGLALTFDEFGMWVHLGGPYWQRASFDAVVVIAALLGLYCAAPALTKFGSRHWTAAVLLVIALVGFGLILADSLSHASEKLSPIFQQIETGGPE
jgi:hypothetical protein